MKRKKTQTAVPAPKPNPDRHESHCSVCVHPEREEIEAEYVSWKSPAKIAAEYKLGDRAAIYHHAIAMNLGPKRDRNIRAALGRIIEKVDDVPVTAGAVVQAVALHAKINSKGELADFDDSLTVNDIFAAMSPDECELYARTGTLPSRFPPLRGAQAPLGSGGDENA